MRSKSSLGVLGIIAVLAVTALPCFAGELAVLKNGFSIQHERREVIGDITRLYTNANGSSYVDVPTSEIEHFEPAAEEANPAPPPALSPLVQTKVAAPTGFPGRPVTDLNQVVNEASGRYRLDPDLVNSVIKAESAFKVHAVSPKGAQGLMQLMPGTASQLGVPNAFDPQANVEGGTKYLRELLEKYNFDIVKALAAYNAGPRKVERFGGVPPYYETRAYVRRIVLDFNKKKAEQQKALAAKKPSTNKAAPNTARRAPASAHSGSAVQAKAVQPSE
jgi:soluble lytic murein transglycosylase-like protein